MTSSAASRRRGRGAAALFHHLVYAAAAFAGAAAVGLTLFATSFALEESYPTWPEHPGLRTMPLWLQILALAEMAFLIVSVARPRLRRWATAGAVAVIVALFAASVPIAGGAVAPSAS